MSGFPPSQHSKYLILLLLLFMISSEKLAVNFVEDPIDMMICSVLLFLRFSVFWQLVISVFEFIVLDFVELYGNIDICLLSNLGFFSHYFFKYSFCLFILFFSHWDSHILLLVYLMVFTRSPWLCLFLFILFSFCSSVCVISTVLFLICWNFSPLV